MTISVSGYRTATIVTISVSGYRTALIVTISVSGYRTNPPRMIERECDQHQLIKHSLYFCQK